MLKKKENINRKKTKHTLRTVIVRTPLNLQYFSSRKSFKCTGNCVNGLTAISSKAPSLLFIFFLFNDNDEKKSEKVYFLKDIPPLTNNVLLFCCLTYLNAIILYVGQAKLLIIADAFKWLRPYNTIPFT